MNDHEHEGEHCTCGATRLPDETMFIVGGQVTPDHDLLPQTVVIVSRSTNPETAMAQVASKIVDDLEKAGIEIDQAEGGMEFRPITSWQDFADLELDDATKMKALSSAIINEFLHQFCRNGSMAEELAAVPWVPSTPEPTEI